MNREQKREGAYLIVWVHLMASTARSATTSLWKLVLQLQEVLQHHPPGPHECWLQIHLGGHQCKRFPLWCPDLQWAITDKSHGHLDHQLATWRASTQDQKEENVEGWPRPRRSSTTDSPEEEELWWMPLDFCHNGGEWSRMASSNKARRVVLCCVILYNLMRKHFPDLQDINMDGREDEGLWRQDAVDVWNVAVDNHARTNTRVKLLRGYLADYFVNNRGAISFQERRIHQFIH